MACNLMAADRPEYTGMDEKKGVATEPNAVQ